MRIAIVIILLFTLSSTASTETLTPQRSMTSNLQGFPNNIGGYFSASKTNSLINFINSAAMIYRDDVKMNIKYIEASMRAAFESEGMLFGLLIQTNSTKSYSRTFIYYPQYHASFQAGICLNNPSWSYFALYTPSGEHSMEMLTLGQGAGISSDLAEIVNKNIKDSDKSICYCSNTEYIQFKIQLEASVKFNVACHSHPGNFAYLPVKNSRWMVTRPGSCYYSFFELVL